LLRGAEDLEPETRGAFAGCVEWEHAMKPTTLLALLALMSAAFADAKPTRVQDLDLSVDVAALEPTVTIRTQENRVEEEYRVNNNVYMIKITPTSGPPYYLVDTDGSGNMEMRRSSAGMDVRVPQWSLFSW
jgi:hypothetical protein